MNIDMGITSILSLLSGVALFLFGMSLMGGRSEKSSRGKTGADLVQAHQYTDQGGFAGNGSDGNHTVLLRHNGHGRRLCELRHDEGRAGDRYHYGGQISVRVSRAGFCVFPILRDQTASHSFCLPRQSQRWSQSSVFCLRWCPRRVHIKMSAISCLDFPY